MKERINFTKMVASGNDFVLIDNRDSALSDIGHSLTDIAKRVCERKLSIGADGLLLIEGSRKADFKMRIFNPDGSEADMCGNGSRCAALYAVENNIVKKDVNIETGAGIINAEIRGLRIKLKLTNPKDIKLNMRFSVGKKTYKVHSLNTGVPHAVLFLDNVDKVNVSGLGRRLRGHKKFKPEGTNCDFVKIINPKEIKIRTYERGIEAETYACGTGAVASAIVSSLIHGLKPHIDVHTEGGEVLRVYFDIKNKKIENVYLEGEAKTVYRGRIDYV